MWWVLVLRFNFPPLVRLNFGGLEPLAHLALVEAKDVEFSSVPRLLLVGLGATGSAVPPFGFH
jgi:hypothetical protein